MNKTYELGALVAPHPDGRLRYWFMFSARLNVHMNETLTGIRKGRAPFITRVFVGCGKIEREGPYTGFADRGVLAKNPSASLGIRLLRLHREGSIIGNPKVKEYFDRIPPPSAGPIPLDWVADLGARKDLEERFNRQVALIGTQQDPTRKTARTRIMTEETVAWVALDNPYRESLLDPLSTDNDLEYYEELARLWEGERKWERDLAAGKHIHLGPTSGGQVRQETTTPAPPPEIIRVQEEPEIPSQSLQDRAKEWVTPDAFIVMKYEDQYGEEDWETATSLDDVLYD